MTVKGLKFIKNGPLTTTTYKRIVFSARLLWVQQGRAYIGLARDLHDCGGFAEAQIETASFRT